MTTLISPRTADSGSGTGTLTGGGAVVEHSGVATPAVSRRMSYSVMVPLVPRRPEQVLPFAALVQWTHAQRLWQGQSVLMESHQQFAHAAGAGFRVPTGLGVTLMPLRHPFEAALQARSVAMATGQPVIAGYGPGAESFQRAILGRPYRSPLQAAREYIGIVRGLLRGESMDVDGTYFRFHGALPAYPAPGVRLGLGVLRPGMARLAGEIADVAITWLTPPDYLAEVVVPALREGAIAAGRDVPRLVAMVPAALRRRDRDPVEFCLAGNSVHMALPHYADMLARSGIDMNRPDPRDRARELIAGRAFVEGDIDSVVGQLDAYRRAGVDELVLNVAGVCSVLGPDAALAELRQLIRATAPRPHHTTGPSTTATTFTFEGDS